MLYVCGWNGLTSSALADNYDDDNDDRDILMKRQLI
jgi:hypothetical protein